MRTVWLIRHAESEANSGLSTNDPGNIDITARGKLQAQAVADYFSEPPSLIVTSPYSRTKQTAQPTLNRFPKVPTEEWSVQEFTYLDAARCIGTTNIQRRPMVAEYWGRCDPDYCDGPEAESFVNLIQRIEWFKTQLTTHSETFIAVFTHGLFIRTLLWMMLVPQMPIDTEYMRQSRIFCESFTYPNGAILKMQITNDNELYFGPLVSTHLISALIDY